MEPDLAGFGGGDFEELVARLPPRHQLLMGGLALSLAGLGVLAALSLGEVPPLMYGIKQNIFNKKTNTRSIYTNGRYLIGPFNRFLLFPAAIQNIEFMENAQLPASGTRQAPFQLRTKDGLALDMELSLQWMLPKENVGALFKDFNMFYEPVLMNTIRDVLTKASGTLEAQQLWTERSVVNNLFHDMLDDGFRTVNVRCWGLQIHRLELPTSFEKSILRTQVQSQMTSTRSYEQRSAQVRAETDVIESEYRRQATVLKAGAQANYTVTTRRAHAQAQKKRIGLEADMLALVRDSLNLTAADLVTYRMYDAIGELPSAELMSGLNITRLLFTERPAPRLATLTPSYPYDGDRWGGLCAAGKRQSPIDLPKCPRAVSRQRILLTWGRQRVEVVHNGVQIALMLAEGSDASMVIDHVAYSLRSCHFHIGSEHTISGEQLPMEMHCVHQQVHGDRFGVLALLFVLGDENPWLANFEDHLPHRGGARSRWHGPLDFEAVLRYIPMNNYWSYQGSLTTPPCTESVDWFIPMVAAHISKAQLAKFAGATGWGSPPAGGNFRPPQPLNGRKIGGC